MATGIDFSNRVEIKTNWIEYTNAASVPSSGSNIGTDLRGFNLKGLTNSLVKDNTTTNMGRPVRVVDNFSQSIILCNTFDGSFNAMRFDNALITGIGAPGIPADNQWINQSTNIDRINGSLVLGSPQNYFTRSITLGDPFAPLPNNCQNLNTPPTSGNGPCYYPDSTSLIQWESVDAVVFDSSLSPIDSSYLEERNKFTSILTLSASGTTDPTYLTWLDIMENSESNLYRNLADSSINQLNTLIELQTLSNFSSAEFAVKRNLFTAALQDQIDTGLVNYSTFELPTLAQTSAWSGTAAVYLARAILEIEVDDEIIGLRTFVSNTHNSSGCLLITKQFSDHINIFYPGIFTVEIFDTTGRLVSSRRFANQYDLTLKQGGNLFIVKIVTPDCIETLKTSM